MLLGVFNRISAPDRRVCGLELAMFVFLVLVILYPNDSLVPRLSSRAVDPLPEKVKREEGLVKLITRLTSRVERR